ncbi:glycosyltransferase family 1 protein [Synechococcus sp. CBW1107]|uniref:glycosyltransferase family 4 protein n=1 Tax=Synechococcus sp. CBW1107 TaxID=2789857 RepID=UPI002AD1EF77|nr:glycosyltransferase family 1 protein [Synechococcus sp. CBW1107]CAK6701999.1 D-inositol-3-phosphate glycosyltransferase [Synechococcus sp. CBW1107]
MPAPPPPLEHLWVDLTPMLPGGANGGAKPFILTLLTELARQHPQVRFDCTCRPELLPELALASPLEPNLHVGPVIPAVAAGRWLGSRRLGRAGRRWRRRLASRPGTPVETGQPNRGEGAQLLYCPFGAPLLHRASLTTVSTFHDLQVQAYPDFFPAAARRERLEHFRQMLAKASRIAAISQFSRQEAIELGGDPGRIVVIPHRMALSRRAVPMAEPPCALPSGRFFLYPANLWRHKNHELLLSAFAMARHQGLPADLKLVCTGDGVDRLEPLRELAEQLGLAEAVLLPGFVSDAELEGLYQHALAVVFPSLYEGFGLPVIEAMARGLPVACSDTTALGEVAGEAALRFHPGHPQQIADALRQLAENPALRDRLIERGLSQADAYAQPAVMAQQYWELFQEAHAAGPVA